jgi:hypothetical protein
MQVAAGGGLDAPQSGVDALWSGTLVELHVAEHSRSARLLTPLIDRRQLSDHGSPMRCLPSASLALICSLGMAQAASAQAASPYQAGADAIAAGDSSLPPGAPEVLHRAAVMVSMAIDATKAPPNILAAEEATAATREAFAAYETALSNYNAGYEPAADSAAARALQFAQVAVTAVLVRHPSVPGVTEEVSAGEVALPSPPASQLPLLTTGDAAPLTLPRSYAEIKRLPFGAEAAEPITPVGELPSPLPFGATSVTRSPALIAP